MNFRSNNSEASGLQYYVLRTVHGFHVRV